VNRRFLYSELYVAGVDLMGLIGFKLKLLMSSLKYNCLYVMYGGKNIR